ncbi:hypothetical protein YC2023_079118 [Brassica napus]
MLYLREEAARAKAKNVQPFASICWYKDLFVVSTSSSLVRCCEEQEKARDKETRTGSKFLVLCSTGKESKKLVLLVLFPLGQGCYKLKSAGMSQVMVAHVFRNSSPRPVEVSETRRWST